MCRKQHNSIYISVCYQHTDIYIYNFPGVEVDVVEGAERLGSIWVGERVVKTGKGVFADGVGGLVYIL